MTIHTFIKRLDCFTVLLEPTDTTFQKVNCVVRFEVDIAKTYIFFPSDPALELPCCFHVLQVMQRLSPHSLHCPIPSLLVNTIALSKIQLPVILGRLNITWCLCITGPCPRMVFATLSKAGWYTRTKVVHLLLIVFQEWFSRNQIGFTEIPFDVFIPISTLLKMIYDFWLPYWYV